MSDDIMYIGKSDSLRVKGYNLEGDQVFKIENDVRYRSITAKDMDQFETDSPQLNHIPDYHPAFVDFHIEDDTRFWFNLGELDEGVNTWTALDSDGSVLAATALPRQLNVQKFQDGKVYGIYQNEGEPHSIKVYDITREL